MSHDEMLEECLDVHKQLLRLQSDLHAWLNRMTGFEAA